ncbi:DUF4168 domain-containing protein [Alteromonas sp. 1_MG-2023]|uniref:DUF4168 domain-containing protein n=1 Tax=Alteromonas sp. 1_MG-2023 TaxID=3062669 RepID=UPI0026E246D4|nr:DUF4168 domain-containing protein [Alteromonas sp. 1_MG-2023]MDO6473876.1 DUF4168 domain-containing protein [Alteromonas sp. 1_MG-2023]
MTKLVKSLVMSLAVACTLNFAAQAAQETKEAAPSSAPMTQSQDFDDATLEKFTVAMNAVSDVADKYQSELKGDETPEKMQQIQQAAQTEMVTEIEKTGLEVQTYTTIAQLVQTDEKLRSRVLDIAKTQNSES